MSLSVIAANKSIGFEQVTFTQAITTTAPTFIIFQTTAKERITVDSIFYKATAASNRTGGLYIKDLNSNVEITIPTTSIAMTFSFVAPNELVTYSLALEKTFPYITNGTTAGDNRLRPREIIVPPNCQLIVKYVGGTGNAATLYVNGTKEYTSP